MNNNKRIGGKLENWCKIASNKRPISKRASTTSEDEYDYYLSGTIVGDDRWNNGSLGKYDSLYTSTVVCMTDNEVETLNTIYQLGEKHQDFDKIWERSVQDLVPWVDLDIPYFNIHIDYLCSTPEVLQYKYKRQENRTIEETYWSGVRSDIDHPTFTLLRNHLEREGYLQVERSWNNGDRVLKSFYLNDKLFEEGEQFPCASAMKYHLEYK